MNMAITNDDNYLIEDNLWIRITHNVKDSSSF